MYLTLNCSIFCIIIVGKENYLLQIDDELNIHLSKLSI